MNAEKDGTAWRWIGPGETGVLIQRSDEASEPGGWQRRESFPANDVRVETVRRVPISYEPYFDGGGRRLTVVPVPRSVRWPLGEDALPGEREGLHAFRDSDETGCVVVPEADARDRNALLEFASHETSLLLVVAFGGFSPRASSAAGTLGSDLPWSIELPRSNVVCVTGSGAASAALFIAGRLERADPVAWRTGSGSVPRRRTPVGSVEPRTMSAFSRLEKQLEETGTLARLFDWRRSAGLRRSIDRGTRWIVFAPDHPFVFRRVEREVRTFLHDLSVDGILPARSSTSARVECRALEGDRGRVRLEVDVELAPARASAGDEF